MFGDLNVRNSSVESKGLFLTLFGHIHTAKLHHCAFAHQTRLPLQCKRSSTKISSRNIVPIIFSRSVYMAFGIYSRVQILYVNKVIKYGCIPMTKKQFYLQIYSRNSCIVFHNCIKLSLSLNSTQHKSSSSVVWTTEGWVKPLSIQNYEEMYIIGRATLL